MSALRTDPVAILRVLQGDMFGSTDKKSPKMVERYLTRANRDLEEIAHKIQNAMKRKAPVGGIDDRDGDLRKKRITSYSFPRWRAQSESPKPHPSHLHVGGRWGILVRYWRATLGTSRK